MQHAHRQHGQLVGTLPYMSPEQVEPRLGDVDTRCDVYSLGVILYKLLTGALPIDVGRDGIAAAVGRICTEQPISIGATTGGCAGDLEVDRRPALEKDPARRYASVQTSCRDELERLLDGRPIEARATRRCTCSARRSGGTARTVSLGVGC